MTQIKFSRYGGKAWQLEIGKIAPKTIERGRNVGEPHPNAGEIVYGTPKFPGNFRALIHSLIDEVLGDEEFVVTNEDELQELLLQLNQTLDDGFKRIEQKLDGLIEGGEIEL